MVGFVTVSFVVFSDSETALHPFGFAIGPEPTTRAAIGILQVTASVFFAASRAALFGSTAAKIVFGLNNKPPVNRKPVTKRKTNKRLCNRFCFCKTGFVII